MKRGMLGAMLPLLFVGCAGYNHPEYIHRVKAQSLEKYASNGIDAVVHFPEREGSEKEMRNISVEDYLSIHTGGLFIGEQLDAVAFQEMFSNSEKVHSEEGMSIKLDAFEGGIAACVPVSDDGYFLTAGHTMDYRNAYIMYTTSNESRTFFAAEKCRLVYRDEHADMAIIKVAMDTPRYLRFRENQLSEGDILFSGNAWYGHIAAGKYLGEGDINLLDKGETMHEGPTIVTSIPAVNGDSGSPVVDKNGLLCGLLLGTRDSKPWRKDLTLAAALDRKNIMDTIACDREQAMPEANTTVDP